MRTVELDTWNRADHFRLFRGYDNPFFNVCVHVDVTALARSAATDGGPSFFLGTVHAAMLAANQIAELRMRIRGESVVVHDVVHPGGTVLRDDDTFTFAYMTHRADFARFQRESRPVLDRARAHAGPLDPRDDRDDLVHFSVLPWITFTSFAHARRWGTGDSVPKIVFGRHAPDGDRRRMPVSVEVHHALVDGLHVGRWFRSFQEHLDAWP